MSERPAKLAERSFAFGAFRLLPEQHLLLEGETPVRIGGRALEILAALVERPGELVRKDELIARVWPNVVVEEINLRVNVAALRKVLGDGRAGRRYVANVPGRGYSFVAQVDRSDWWGSFSQARQIRQHTICPTHRLKRSAAPTGSRPSVGNCHNIVSSPLWAQAASARPPWPWPWQLRSSWITGMGSGLSI